MFTIDNVDTDVTEEEFLNNLSFLRTFVQKNNLDTCNGVTEGFFQTKFGRSIRFAHFDGAPKIDFFDRRTAYKHHEFWMQAFDRGKKNNIDYQNKYENSGLWVDIAITRLAVFNSAKELKNKSDDELFNMIKNDILFGLDDAFDSAGILESIHRASKELAEKHAFNAKDFSLVDKNFLNTATKKIDDYAKQCEELVISSKQRVADKQGIQLQEEVKEAVVPPVETKQAEEAAAVEVAPLEEGAVVVDAEPVEAEAAVVPPVETQQAEVEETVVSPVETQQEEAEAAVVPPVETKQAEEAAAVEVAPLEAAVVPPVETKQAEEAAAVEVAPLEEGAVVVDAEPVEAEAAVVPPVETQQAKVEEAVVPPVETKQAKVEEAVVPPVETQQAEVKEPKALPVETQKTEQEKTNKSNDTKAYRDFGEILKDKSLSEEEQMWYLDGLIEEEKQEVAMKEMANKLVELRGLGKEKKGSTIKRDLPSNMVNKMIENKSKQPPS